MKYLIGFFVLFIFFIPNNVFGACSADGLTVVYINGIFTSNRSDAEKDTKNLEKKFEQKSDIKNIKFITGYNESHIAGVSDIIESISQALGSPVSNYDRNSILLEIYPQVTTRKILLLGHSQGTFYTNEIYDYLTKHGEQEDAVGVYNVATPADHVAASGAHLTSKNDKVINGVRDIALKANAKQPLQANIDIPLTPTESTDRFGGHSFSGVYLANASTRITSDIDSALKKLSATEVSEADSAGCFTPPPRDISYYTQKAVFAVADPAATGVVIAGKSTIVVGEIAYNGTLAAIQSVVSLAKNLSNDISHQGLALVSNFFGNSSQQNNDVSLNDSNSKDSQIETDSADSQQESDISQLALSPETNAKTSQEPSAISEADDPSYNATDTTKNAAPTTSEDNPGSSGGGGGGGGGGSPPVGASGPVPNQSVQNNSNNENSQLNATSSSQNENSSSTSSNSSSTSDISNSTSTGSSSSSSQTSHILISEILFNPAGSDEGKEFIELYNPSDNELDLAEWSLKYKKENTTSTVSLASFKSSSHPEDKTLVKAKSFILVGLNSYDSANYGGKSADIIRTGALPNGETGSGQVEKVELILHNAGSSEVDKISYDKNSISSEGQSLERKSFSNNICVSAQASSTAGEFLGNGCDTDSTDDFEIRTLPNPQNFDSLPESRSVPTINNFQASYNFAPRLDFSWGLSVDAVGSTSTNKYFVYDTTDSSSTVSIFESTSTPASNYSFSETINEVGRNYDFQFKVQDRDGLSNTAMTTVLASSFLDKFYFYSLGATSTSYLFDLTTTSSRPFWDKTNSGGYGGWKAIVFYLNKDAPKESQLDTDHQMVPSDNSYIRVGYEGCGGGSGNNSELIFPPNDASCVPGPLSAAAYNFRKLEDSRLAVGISGSNSGAPFSSNDYVTLAFYDFGGGGGGNQWLNLAAVDKTKYYFKDAPQNQNVPTTPGNLSANFDDISGKLNLSWSSSTDADTLDRLINYQLNYSTSSVLNDSDWQSVSSLLYASIIPISPNSYKIGVRAIDDFNNTSTAAIIDWNFPAGFTPYILSQSQNSATQAFSLNKDGQLKSVKIFTDSFQTDSRNELANICYLDIYEVTATSTDILSGSDKPHPADGSSGEYAYRGTGCAGYLTFTYTNGPKLIAGHNYIWKFYFSSSDHGSVKFFGTTTDTASGLFSDPTIKNAKFTIQDDSDTLFDN